VTNSNTDLWLCLKFAAAIFAMTFPPGGLDSESSGLNNLGSDPQQLGQLWFAFSSEPVWDGGGFFQLGLVPLLILVGVRVVGALDSRPRM